MKNLITILCLLCFAGCASAEIYQVPGSLVETTSEVTVQQDNTKEVKSETKITRKKRRRTNWNEPNTYWNFGKPFFWTGSI